MAYFMIYPQIYAKFGLNMTSDIFVYRNKEEIHRDQKDYKRILK